MKFSFLFLLLLSFSVVFAQDGSAPPDSRATSSSALEPSSGAISTPRAVPAFSSETISPQPTPPPVIVPPPAPDPVEPAVQNSPPTAEQKSLSEPRSGVNPAVLWGGAVALLLGGYGAYKLKRARQNNNKEEKEDGSRCFDIKKLMEEKFKELTDLKGQLEGKIKGAARDKIREAAEGTAAGDLLAVIERAEKEYGRLKMLYEKCMIETDSSAYRGIIIEESLQNKEVLKKVKIISTEIEQVTEEHKTPWIRQWTLHEIEVEDGRVKEVADELARSLDAEHAWYADFKNPSHHYVIFRDKVFFIDRKNKEQYDEAKRYGISLGIPEYQVDFHPGGKKWER